MCHFSSDHLTPHPTHESLWRKTQHFATSLTFGADVSCFFWLSREWRAILAQQMFEKWSETDVFCTFLLQNVRFATAACIFSISELQKVLPDPQFFLTFSLPNAFFTTAACIFPTSKLQKVLPDPQFFNIFTSKCVFHHSGVHFFNIWTSKSAPGPSIF